MNRAGRVLLGRVNDFEWSMKKSLENTTSKETCIELLDKLKTGYEFFSLFQYMPALKGSYPVRRSLRGVRRVYESTRDKAESLGVDVTQYPAKLKGRINKK